MNYTGEKVTKEVLNSGERIFVPTPNAKNHKTIEFSAKVASFGEGAKLTVGHGKNIIWCAAFVEIDSEHVYVYEMRDVPNLVDKVPHGLSITDFIKVSICAKEGFTAKLEITTATGSFSKDTCFVGSKGDIFAEPTNATFNDCTLYYYIDGVNKDVWLFGDSYFDCWCKLMVEAGCGDCYLDGRSGRESPDAIESLKMDLLHGTPKKVIWLMGMNDPDEDDKVSGRWFECYNTLCQICSEKNIELILTTIPTTSTRNHDFKNDIIVNSGYKYLDLSAELGADKSNSWGEGLLSPDCVHPTAEGAKVIAKFMTEYLTQNK